MPYRISPVFPLRGLLPDLFFIDFHAQSGTGEQIYLSVFILKYRSVHKIIHKIRTLIVMDAKALLLAKRILRTEIQLQAAGQSHRARRTVGATAIS